MCCVLSGVLVEFVEITWFINFNIWKDISYGSDRLLLRSKMFCNIWNILHTWWLSHNISMASNSWWILHKYFAQAQRNLYKCWDCENLEVGSLAGESAIGFLVISQRSRVAQTEAPLAAITPPSHTSSISLNFSEFSDSKMYNYLKLFTNMIFVKYTSLSQL